MILINSHFELGQAHLVTKNLDEIISQCSRYVKRTLQRSLEILGYMNCVTIDKDQRSNTRRTKFFHLQLSNATYFDETYFQKMFPQCQKLPYRVVLNEPDKHHNPISRKILQNCWEMGISTMQQQCESTFNIKVIEAC